MNTELKIIKKKYGENMMKLCRKLFPTLLEDEGLLLSTLLNIFDKNTSLYDDIISNNMEKEFKRFIYSFIKNPNDKLLETDKTPKQLFDLIDYDFYECTNEEEIQSFKKYFSRSERLCTFKGNRLDDCYVFFAVKRNALDIKRENFKNPSREDEYGVSVISIQFTKDKSHTLSIKNRYNHTVNNPDATFCNNLEKIIPGLTKSFEKTYELVQSNPSQDFEIPGYVKANDGKYYKYNYEINNIYYCTNNVIIDNYNVKKFDKEKYIILDYFILDLKNKKISMYDKKLIDSFLYSISNIKNIEVLTLKDYKLINIKTDENNIYIKLDKNNMIIEYSNENVKEIKDNFLFLNKTLKRLNLPNVLEIGNSFLYLNKVLEHIDVHNVKKIGFEFLEENRCLRELNVPNLVCAGHEFMPENRCLERLCANNLERIGYEAFRENRNLNTLILSNLLFIGDSFFRENNLVNVLNLSNLGKEYYHRLSDRFIALISDEINNEYTKKLVNKNY